MKLHRWMRGTVAGVLVTAAMGGAAHASSVTVATITGSNAGAPMDGTATFTMSDSGHLMIDLTNNVANPTSAGSLLGGIIFTLSPTATFAGVMPTNFSVSGNLIDINLSADTFSAATASQINALGTNDHWAESPGNAFTLKVANGNDPLIIGAPDENGLYTNANPSLGPTHQPFFKQTAEFNMDIAGLTSKTLVSSVTFEWGTGYTQYAATHITTVPQGGGSPPPQAVPLPAAAWSGMALLAGLGLVRGWRRRMTV